MSRGAFPAAVQKHVRYGNELFNRPSRSSGWSVAGLAGRLVELSGAQNSAALTMALGLVRQAQLLGDPVAWVTLRAYSFFPPDVAAGGVDLNHLVVVRVAQFQQLGSAADHLARCGAFGLIVLDLAGGNLTTPVQSRLRGLAQKHDLALIFLTQKRDARPSLGSLISLRVCARRRRIDEDRFICELRVLKDKHRAPGWHYSEVCRGPAGLH